MNGVASKDPTTAVADNFFFVSMGRSGGAVSNHYGPGHATPDGGGVRASREIKVD